MFDTVKAKAAKQSLIDLLTYVVGVTGTHGFGFASEADLVKLHKAEPTFIVIDSTMKDEKGNVKVTATPVAIEALKATDAPASGAPAAAKPEPMKFDIVYFDEVPPIKTGGGKTDSYPFDKLPAPEVKDGKTKYASFFVASTEAKPNPSKFLSSTVASANKRHAKGDLAEYTVRRSVGADGKVNGAHVIRIK